MHDMGEFFLISLKYTQDITLLDLKYFMKTILLEFMSRAFFKTYGPTHKTLNEKSIQNIMKFEMFIFLS